MFGIRDLCIIMSHASQWCWWLCISLDLVHATKVISTQPHCRQSTYIFTEGSRVYLYSLDVYFRISSAWGDSSQMRWMRSTNIPSECDLFWFCFAARSSWLVLMRRVTLSHRERARGGCETQHRRIGLPILYFATLCHTYTSQSRNKVYRAPHRDGIYKKKTSRRPRLGKQSI